MKHTEETKRLLSRIRTRHGCSRPHQGLKYKTFTAWRSMKQRCLWIGHKSYKDYGGRGIKICKRWMIFDNFLSDMGICPPKMTLGRINNTKGYNPKNCRWETYKEQSRNTRGNTLLTFKGITQTLQEWSEEIGIGRDTIGKRLASGWSVKDALTKPLGPTSKRYTKTSHSRVMSYWL